MSEAKGLMVDVNAMMNFFLQLAAVIGAIVAGYMWVRRWVRSVASNSSEAVEQLKTSNPHSTAGQLIESTAKSVDELKGLYASLTEHITANRTLAERALALAEHTSDRLDAHLTSCGATRIDEPSVTLSPQSAIPHRPNSSREE